MGSTNNLHGDLGWSKTNKNFSGVLRALRREHQGGMMGIGGTVVPPTYSATIMASSSDALLGTYSGGREDIRHKEG